MLLTKTSGEIYYETCFSIANVTIVTYFGVKATLCLIV